MRALQAGVCPEVLSGVVHRVDSLRNRCMSQHMLRLVELFRARIDVHNDCSLPGSRPCQVIAEEVRQLGLAEGHDLSPLAFLVLPHDVNAAPEHHQRGVDVVCLCLPASLEQVGAIGALAPGQVNDGEVRLRTLREPHVSVLVAALQQLDGADRMRPARLMIDVVRRRLALCRSLLEESDGLRWILDNHLPQAIHFNVPMPILDLEPAPRPGVCFIQQVENLLVVNLEERQAKSDLVLVLPL
mmetsp:Transcript_6748/g.26093  ORF Transcript_6748/g.26093 Transcript_6748/m.26093 type:complete len:242 (-) Transcript_6748:28-753(-)